MAVSPTNQDKRGKLNKWQNGNFATAAEVVGGVQTITGSGFGANAATQHLSSDVFKSQALGAAPQSNGWNWDGYSVEVANDADRGKVLKGSTQSGGNLNNVRAFDFGSTIAEGTDVFISWWTKLETDATGSDTFQWKMFRLESTLNYVDGGPEIAQFNWLGGTGKMLVLRPTLGNEPVDTLYLNPYPDYAQFNTWSRCELALEIGTQSAADSNLHVAHYPKGAASEFLSHTGKTLYSTADRYRWFVWQNYIGNGSSATITQRDFSGDDYYIQVGSLKRVMLSNNVDPTLATFTQIQKWTSWTDTAVEIEPNLVDVADGSYQLLVMDGANTVLGSKAVTVTSGVLS